MKQLLLFTAILIATTAFSQDYMKVREQLVPVVCGDRDSILLNEIRSNLENFDTSNVTKNLQVYYSDLSICYWELAVHINTFDTTLILLGINAYQKALYHEPSNTQALWNLAYSYRLLDDCDNTQRYLTLYKKYEKRKYWDKEQIGFLEEHCPEP